MKHNIKIVITPTKLCYSICYVILLSLVRGVSSSSEIGVAMDAYVAVLAIIFFSDTYYQEVQANRWEVFHLLPTRAKYMALCQRMLVQTLYMCLLIGSGYWGFYLQRSIHNQDTNELCIYITAVLACSVTVVFFGTFTVTMVNAFHNLWAGIGVALLLWYLLNSSWGRKLLDYINIFAYKGGVSTGLWMKGKLFALILSILLLLINYKLLNRQERLR